MQLNPITNMLVLLLLYRTCWINCCNWWCWRRNCIIFSLEKRKGSADSCIAHHKSSFTINLKIHPLAIQRKLQSGFSSSSHSLVSLFTLSGTLKSSGNQLLLLRLKEEDFHHHLLSCSNNPKHHHLFQSIPSTIPIATGIKKWHPHFLMDDETFVVIYGSH
jgi:hypothetical protein